MRNQSPANRLTGTLKEEVLKRCTVGKGCWSWTRAVGGSNYKKGGGYGVFSYQGRRLLAHRASWEAFNEPVPSGLYVLHRCDNSRCVNPSHLFLGTHQDNVDDCVAKRRHTLGERHPGHKITEDDVHRIRKDRRYVKDIAAHYGLSKAQVFNIRNGSHWRHVL